MIICQVDMQVQAMGQEDIEQELKVVGEVLAALDGELLGAEVGDGFIVAYVCAESELVVSDLFEASHFTVERIAYLGPSHEAHLDFSRPVRQGMWRYRPAPPAMPQAAAVSLADVRAAFAIPTPGRRERANA